MTKKQYDWVEFIAKSDNEIEVVSDAGEAELADFLVCRLITDPLMLPDNLTGTCTKCFRMIQFRAHVPKRPKKVCDDCATKLVGKQKDLTFLITKNTMADLVALARKKAVN